MPFSHPDISANELNAKIFIIPCRFLTIKILHCTGNIKIDIEEASKIA
jgi:hypothetical protein